MHPKRAEYSRMLSNDAELLRAAKLEARLFAALPKRETYTEDFHFDKDKIFDILQSTYENPRAMNCFIFYDIENNKLRTQIAKYLLRKSCQRIQKSVYLANINKNEYHEITNTLKELNEVLGDNDSIFFVPVGEYHLAEMLMIGKDVDMAFSRSTKHTIFI